MVEARFEPGTRVTLQGLAARPELNGEVVVVLAPASAEETAQLEATGRAKVSHYPKALSLRAQSLELAPPPDWSRGLPFPISDIVRGAPSVLEVAQAAVVAGEDLGALGRIHELQGAEDLAEALWAFCGRGEVGPAKELPDDFAELVLDTPGHWLYWIGLEQVSHHVIVEACDCTWRIYQASAPRRPQPVAKADEKALATGKGFEEFGGVLLESGGAGRRQRGYRAGAWASWEASDVPSASSSGPPPPDVVELDKDKEVHEELPEELLAARARWAGGRELTWEEAAIFLRLIADLKEQARDLALKLKEQTPCSKEDDEVAAEWARQKLEAASGDFTVMPSRPGSPRSGPGYAEASDLWLFSPPDMKPTCDLSLPTTAGFAFMRTFGQLVGEYPDGRCFLALLEFLGWESLEREDGGRVGWTLRARDLRGGGQQR
mmetsp:Transcript_49902/g.143410  ORF Transcript_49902/g.143410 Transcript_49902/m.143410 type:complete len:434 (-) Transcript_49902:58-1359(-)